MNHKSQKQKICLKRCFMLLFFCLAFFVMNVLCFDFCGQVQANAKNIDSKNQIEFKIFDGETCHHFFENDFNERLSDYQKEFRKRNVSENLKMLNKIGFSKKEAINYIFPEVQRLFNVFSDRFEKSVVDDKVVVLKNSCEIQIKKGECGRFLNENKFYQDALNSILSWKKSSENHKKSINIKLVFEEFSGRVLNQNNCSEKSCFLTNFETSSSARKNNIRVALSAFDGFVLEDGETLSFNTVTGSRNAEAGYLPAKIISGGTFVEGFGGGVCQVSTTLYNACLLAGLEILEVHNHSLPVSYIEPSFDAMVNTGSSDLVVKNNTGERLIFTTSSKGDTCKVKIFGKPNEFKITRFSEKTKIIPAEKEEMINDSKKAEEFGVEVSEEIRISFAKDGFCSNGYLNYYDKNGNLVKTKKIRSNTYNPTKGVVVKNVA